MKTLKKIKFDILKIYEFLFETLPTTGNEKEQ